MEGLKQENKWVTFGSCLLVGTVFLLLLPAALRFMYVIHDDVYIRDIAAGAISGQPDIHLVYMNAALGYLLAGLYGAFPGIDWYGAGLTVLSMACFLAVLYRLLTMGKRKLLILAGWMAGVLLSGLYYLVLFQYTVTAGIAGATAIFLFGTRDKDARILVNRVELGLVGFLLVLTYLIRQETFLIVFPVFFCVLAYEWFQKKEKSCVGLLISVILLIGIFFAINKAAYADPAWDAYMRYNEARTQVFDYYGVPPYAGNEAFYSSIGMEEHDVVNLDRYNVYLVKELPGEKLEEIAAYAKQQYLAQHSYADRIKNCLKTVFWGIQEVETSPLNWLTLAAAVGACVLCVRNRSRRFWLWGAVCGLEAAFWLYLGWQGRFFWRVGACLFLVCLAAMGAVILTEWNGVPAASRQFAKGLARLSEKLSGKTGKVLLLALGLLVVILSVAQVGKVSAKAQAQYEKDQELATIRAYCAEHPEHVYFSIVGLLHPYSEVFDWAWTPQVPNLMSLGDWTAFTPVTEKRLENYGISCVPEALVKNENVYLILNGESSAIEKSCLAYADAVRWEMVDRILLPEVELAVYRLWEE